MDGDGGKDEGSRDPAAGGEQQELDPGPGQQGEPEQAEPAERPEDPEEPQDPQRSDRAAAARELWFRFSTRVRAVGYWLREKLQHARPALEAGWRRLGRFWAQRSTGERVGLGAAATLLFLLLLVRIVPVPGVPCQVSVKECPPAQESFDLVPADALMYAHATIDEGSDQFERSSDAFERLSDLRTILAAELPSALPVPSGAQIDFSRDVLPWAERDLALTLLPGKGKSSVGAFVIGVGDREGAEEFVAKLAPSAEPQNVNVGDTSMSVYAGDFAAAFVEDSLVMGEEPAVRATINTGAGDARALADSGGRAEIRDELPESRFAEVYLSRPGVQRLLAGRAGSATQLETFVDYGATDGVAAAAVAEDDGVKIELFSSLDPELVGKSPSFFSELPEFEPTLQSEAGAESIAFAGVGELGPTFAQLLSGAGDSALAGSLQGLSRRLRKEAGVDPLGELLPALGGQAALVAEPTDGVPFASLIVDGVDEERAAPELAKLQRPLVQALGTAGGQVRRFEEQEVDGVTVRSVQASPTINLSYALFDGKLVVSTDPAGIAQVREDSGGLDGSEAFERATGELPERVSALVFLNLDELFGQVTRTDLVEDPFFANLSVLFDNAASVALAVNGDDDEIRSEMFLALD